jgi:hypothetical protein
MLRTQVDLCQYNNMISREVNFRPTDDSGFRNTPGSIRYLSRLFSSEGDVVVDRINSKNIALQLVTHHIAGVIEPLANVLDTRLYLIEVVRHPLSLVRYWTEYFSDFDRPREFTICFDERGLRVPWFAAAWADEFAEMSPVDQSVRAISQLQTESLRRWSNIRSIKESAHGPSQQLLGLPFEFLVTDTHLALSQLSSFLGRPTTLRTKRALSRQRIPRNLSDRGRASNSRSWIPDSSLSFREQLVEIETWLRQKGTLESNALMREATEQYELHLANFKTYFAG